MPWHEWSDLMGREFADSEIAAFCEGRGIDWRVLSDGARRWLHDDLRRAQHAYWTETLNRIGKLDSFESELRDYSNPAGATTVAVAPQDSSEEMRLSYQEVVSQYFTEVARSGGVAAKTDADKRAALTLLAEITGEKPVAAITKADAQRAKQILMQYPRDRHKHRSTKGKPLGEVLDLPDRPKIAAKTMNGYLSNMETFMGWAVRNGHADANHFAGMQVKTKRAKADQRDQFTNAQLSQLLEQLTANPLN